MVNNIIEKNAFSLETELEWFLKVINTRIKLHFGRECGYRDIFEIEPPSIEADNSTYENFINHYRLSFAERIIFILCLIPHIKPQLLDIFLTTNKETGRQVTEFGGLKDLQTGLFIPTAETALFILAGEDLKKRFLFYHIFEADHYFVKQSVMNLISTCHFLFHLRLLI